MMVLQADLSWRDAPNMIFDFMKDKKLSIDILVNNAGVDIFGEIDSCAE